jgi:hypothetical protein
MATSPRFKNEHLFEVNQIALPSQMNQSVNNPFSNNESIKQDFTPRTSTGIVSVIEKPIGLILNHQNKYNPEIPFFGSYRSMPQHSEREANPRKESNETSLSSLLHIEGSPA